MPDPVAPVRPEPLRRRVRSAALRGLSRTPGPLVHGALFAASGLARWSRFERIALDNLERVLGPTTGAAERARIARGVRRHAARQLEEWLRLARTDTGTGAWVDELVELDPSVARLDALAAEGRGLLLATAHLGNWELLATALRRRGLDGAVVGRHRRNDSSSTWLVDLRARHGIRTLAQDAPAREVLGVLRRGASLGLVCDLEVRRVDGVFADFLGLPALTMTAPAALARNTGLPVVPVRCVARGRRYLLSVEEPLHLRTELGRAAAQRALLEGLNAVFGRWIREDPEQWAWHQPRWRTRPAPGPVS